jgi:hypothetical protein
MRKILVTGKAASYCCESTTSVSLVELFPDSLDDKNIISHNKYDNICYDTAETADDASVACDK